MKIKLIKYGNSPGSSFSTGRFTNSWNPQKQGTVVHHGINHVSIFIIGKIASGHLTLKDGSDQD